MIINSLLVVFAYLVGSICSAIIVCRIFGLSDPRTEGSNNPGATNVLRLGGKKAAAITLFGDVVKGFIPVIIAKYVGVDSTVLALCAMAAFLGHLYPVFYQFKGGKGVATAFGVILGISFYVGLLLAATWLLLAYLSKISSLSALIAACLAPIYFGIIMGDTGLVLMSILMSSLLIYRHRSNIRDLIAGKEGKIGNKD